MALYAKTFTGIQGFSRCVNIQLSAHSSFGLTQDYLKYMCVCVQPTKMRKILLCVHETSCV